jgi:hypothetical protein
MGALHHRVHLLGSASMESASQAMETFAKVLGPALMWIPDGETDRPWMPWLAPIFETHPQLEASDEFDRRTFTTRKYRVKKTVDPDAFRFDSLPHAAVALKSYSTFSALKAEGKIPAHCKFLFPIATPAPPVRRYIVDADQALVEKRYEEALIREVQSLASAIPAGELAIQWDSTQMVQIEQGRPTSKGATRDEILATVADDLVRLGEGVPRDVDLIYHLCYGDSGHKHVVEPSTLAHAVALVNRIALKITRPVQLIHMPVPRDRSDDAYFEPLRDLKLQAGTQLCLGLVHLTDGVPGTRKRIETAKKFRSEFVIATECGMARRPASAMVPLLKVQAEVAGVA